MAWFGDNLKNITGNLTGQLSSVANTAATFTRDVLAEGTEEVSDHTTELKVAQDKIRDLEAFVISQKAENERLQLLNSEMEEKAEASELQINTISQQYRTMLQEKQDEIKTLKQQQHAMQDLHQNMMSASADAAGLTSSTSTSSLSSSAITADDRDFVDVISSQHEINRLSSEVSRLTAECNHWKQLADVNSNQQPHFQMGDDYIDSADDSVQLKARIKELERQLSREIDESQHQMSTLQNAHSQKMATLAKKHKAEVEDYQIRIEELEQVLSSGSSSPSSTPTTPIMRVGSPPATSEEDKVRHLQESLKKAQQSIAQMESENQGLQLEVETLRQSDRYRGQDVMGLHQQIEHLEQEKEKLSQENDILKYVKKDLAAKLDIEQEEVKKMKVLYEEIEKKAEKEKELMEKQKLEEVELLQQRIKEQEDKLGSLREDNDQVRDELYATKLRLLAELDASHANASSVRQEVQGARKKFSSQAMLRRTRLLQEKQDLVNRMIEVGEQVSEGKDTVATLEAASDDVLDQTADIIADMGSVDQQELTSEFIACLESENTILRDKVTHLESVEQKLSESCASLAEDKEQCEKMIVRLNKRIQRIKQGKDVLDAETSSEGTLECAVDSETESTAKLKTSRSGSRRAQSPSAASTDSDVTASSDAAPPRRYMSEGTIESDLPDARFSHLESSDNVSFDGEYDDSIMFGGIKERYPEAANALKEQIEQFELVRADWEMEKEALEEVVVRMRDQLKEKDRALQSLTAEKGLMELETQQTEELNAAVEEMDEKIETLEAAKKTLEEDKAVVLKEKESLELKIRDLESAHQEQVAKLHALTEQNEHLQVQLTDHEESIHNLSLEVETYKSQLQEKETSLLNVSQDRSRLENELQELDNQHQEAINQVISSKDNMSKMVEDLKEEVASLSEQLVEKDTILNDSQSFRENLETELEQAKERLQQENLEFSEAQKSSQEHEQQVSNLQSELQKLSDSNKVLDNRKCELEVEVNELSTKAASLEAELIKAKQQRSDMIDINEKARLDDVIAKLQQELNEVTSSKEQKEKECVDQHSELAEKETRLSEVLSEKKHLNRTLNEKEEQCQVLSLNLEQKSKELSDLQLDVEALAVEKETLSLDLKHSQQAMEDQKQQFENTLHELSESRDLDTSKVQDEYEKLILVKNEQDSELSQLKIKCDNLEDDLCHTKEMLNSTLENHKQLADVVKEKETDIKSLAEENSFFFKAVEEGKTKLKEQLEELKRLENIESQLDDLKEEKASLTMRIKELEDAGNHWEDAETKTLGLITEMEAELEQFKKTLQEKDQEVSRLNQVVEEQQTSLSELQDQCSQQADELELSQSKLAESTNDFTSLNHSIRDKDIQISELGRELEQVKQMLSDEQSSRLEEADSSIVAKEAEVSELKQQVDKLSAELNNTNQSFMDKLTQKEEDIGMLQEHITELNQDVESNQRKANDMQDKVDRISQEKDCIISELKDKVTALSPKNGSIENYSEGKDIQTNGPVVESPIIVRDVELTQTSTPSSMNNPNLHPAMSDTEKQFEKMVQERDREIKILKENNQSALNLLEEKSQSSFGNSTLVDLHKLQMQVRTYNSERNQMMTVLNEKTRECSNLKNEVHRLVKTIAAEKSALEKALADNRDLQQSMQGPRNDMQKEAVQKLARLIQDKDLEIEALKQKNESLLQVLQQTAAPNDSTQISKVLQDNEQLQKENKVLKEERDQLVVSIHQKHHESLTYYEEVQRLAGVISTENQKHADLQEKYNSIYADLDEKEKSACELEAQLQEKDKSLSALQSELDQRNESVSFMEGRLVNMNESIAGLENRNKELEDLVSVNHHKQNQEDDLHLKVIEDKDAEILDLKQQLQTMTLMSLDQAEDREVIKVESAHLQHAPPHSQLATPPPASQSQVDPDILEAKDKEIATLKDTVEHQSRLISEKEATIKRRNEELERNQIDVASLRQEIDIQNQNLLERDAALQLRNHERQELNNRLKSQEVELQSVKHANQTLTVQIQGYTQEIKTLKNENQTLQHAVHNKDGENRSLQDLSNRLAVQVQEKEFEIGALKEKNATLASIVQEKDVGNHGELQRVLRETEAMQRQAQLFQHERDQALLALQRHQADTQAKDNQIQGLRQKEQQLGRELERLRNHLLEMEDGYTQEALQAEEREKELRTKLVQAEERARTSSSAVQNASKEATAQIESLLDQLHSTTDQKDQALLQLASAQEQAQQYATSLNNLQMVLEQFQQEKDTSIASEVEMYQIRAQEKDRVASQLMKTNVELQEKLAAATEALEGASRLSEQLDKKEEVIEHLRIDNETKAQHLEEFQKQFEEVSNVQESKVDKPLVKNLFLGYFHAPKSKRGEVLKVMASLLNFSQDEIGQIANEGQQSQGWLSGFWGRRGTVAPTPPSSPRPKSAFDSSFTESFVKFLEEESCPKPHMRLPIEEMTSSKPRNPTFNPFSAPIPQNSPFIQTSPTTAKGPGVPLPIPAASTLTAVPVPVRTATPVMDGGSGQGRGSPARSAAVLKDILQ